LNETNREQKIGNFVNFVNFVKSFAKIPETGNFAKVKGFLKRSENVQDE